jgi:uncharacterized membrane protein YfcA
MEFTYDIVALLALVAFVAGFIDAMAGGGGLLTIPALIAAGASPLSALATNKLQSTFGTGSAFIAFARGGHIDLRRFAWPVAMALAGSAAGALVVQRIDPSFLAGLVPAMLILMALYFLVGPRMSDIDRHARIGTAGLLAVTAAIGFYDGFFGPGTGSFFTLALVALAGLGLVRAIAHTKLLNFATNISALAAMIAGGHILWLVGSVMAMASVAGNHAGAHVAMRYSGRGVRPLLVIMSIALTVKLLSDPANPLRIWVGMIVD